MGEIQAELEELASPLPKKAKRVHSRLANRSANDDSTIKTGSKVEGENRGEPRVSSGPSDNDIAQRPRGRPRKNQPSFANAASHAASVMNSSPANTRTRDRLQLAKAQITNLRYAAAECDIPEFAQRVRAIFNVKTMPSTRWDAYRTLATEVDRIFRTRGMMPIFMDPDVIRTVRPLFQDKDEEVRNPVTTNGGAPKFHKSKPSSRPFTATQLTISTPSTGTPSSTWTGQSHNNTNTSHTSAFLARQSSTFASTPTSAAPASAPARSSKVPSRKRKQAPITSGTQSASASKQAAQGNVSYKRKKISEPAAGPPTVTCFFCTVSRRPKRCFGNIL